MPFKLLGKTTYNRHMTDKQNNFGDGLIVPERDELRSHGKKQRRGNSLPMEEELVRHGTGGGVKFLLVVLVLGLLGTGGAGYFFYVQGQGVLEELDLTRNRLLQLESRLAMTDEVAQETSMGFLEKVDFNFSEIDKLWAARNQNRTNITTNKTAIAASNVALENHEETFTAMERVLGGQSTAMNENTVLLEKVQTQVETLSNTVTGISRLNLEQQFVVISDDLDLLKDSIDTMPVQDVGLVGRVDSNEQDIESINIYRLQVNQKLSAIQDSINKLQQQFSSQL